MRSNDLRRTKAMVPVGQKRKLKSPAAGEGPSGFPGAKSSEGVIHRIINLIPPHDTLIEACGGSGALTWNIRPAKTNIIIEVDPVQADLLKKAFVSRAIVWNDSFYDVINTYSGQCAGQLIYFDPPYLKETRTSKADLYFQEWLLDDHANFIEYVNGLQCLVLINHPPCPLYSNALSSWNKVEYRYMSRKGWRNDCLWFNYDPPEKLHDYRWLGDSNTERQCIRRKIHSMMRKISELPTLQREMLFHELNNLYVK